MKFGWLIPIVGLALIFIPQAFAGTKELMDYENTRRIFFKYGSVSWNVRDKHDERRLMIAPMGEVGRATGLTTGFSFGARNPAFRKSDYKAAVNAWLASKHDKCQAIEGHELYRLKWEFTYSCEEPY